MDALDILAQIILAADLGVRARAAMAARIDGDPGGLGPPRYGTPPLVKRPGIDRCLNIAAKDLARCLASTHESLAAYWAEVRQRIQGQPTAP